MRKMIVMMAVAAVMTAGAATEEQKPRLVVCTDIAPADVEPDDMQSTVRLMAYADRFEIEALITSVGWNCDPYPLEWQQYLFRVITAYAKDVPNLMRRSGQKGFLPIRKENGQQKLGYWPSAEYITSRAVMGSMYGGIKAIGERNDSPGSELLIRLADEDDPRPIYVAAWGGANTLAQAIWRVKQTRSDDEVKKFVRKFRLFTITDQDMQYNMRMNRAYSSHMWLRKDFADDLQFIWDEGAWQEQCELGKQHWQQHQDKIQGHGALGKEYPDYKWGVEGDTPSFLYVMPNGLNDPEDPRQAGWAGYHERGLCADSLTTAWTSWQEPLRSISVGYKRRFYPDELNDFMARMQWADKGRGNHNPLVVVNGKKGLQPVLLSVKAGETLRLDASKSVDPDGDALVFSWWQQPEIGKTKVTIEKATQAKVVIHIPEDAAGDDIHVICEVHDNGPFRLVSYRRVIIHVASALSHEKASGRPEKGRLQGENGDGTYTNPVINADYSDPDVCVGPSGEDYYMTASSFHCTPGLPILHSRDLVNWEMINYAIGNLYEGDDELLRHFSSRPQHGNGVWAPSIRYHDGWYYIYWGDPDFGVFMVKTQDPAGQWTKPLCVIHGQGYIDPTPLWDDDGRCYMVNAWANSRSKFASVLTVREMSADGTRPIGQPVIVFDGNGTENRTCEGPKFYKRDGWYWILCPAGGVPTGFQLAMRSKSPYGPYEHKVVLKQGKTDVNGPHQGGWVHTKYGEDWFLHFQDKEAYGRVVHLQPVDWSSGWPVMGRKGEPVTTFTKPKSSQGYGGMEVRRYEATDEFNSPKMGKQWQWHGNYDEKFGTATAFGTYRLYTYKLSDGWKNFWEVPSMLLQKTPADEFTVTTKLRFTSKAEGQFGGLVMMGLDYSALVVKRVGKTFQLVQMTCHQADKGNEQTETVIATLKPTAEDKTDYKPGIHEDIYLRLTVTLPPTKTMTNARGYAGHPQLQFAYSLDGKTFHDCGEPFAVKQGKWIGAKFGFIAAESDAKADRGWIDADWLRVTLPSSKDSYTAK